MIIKIHSATPMATLKVALEVLMNWVIVTVLKINLPIQVP
jgi:hypothetical protein